MINNFLNTITVKFKFLSKISVYNFGVLLAVVKPFIVEENDLTNPLITRLSKQIVQLLNENEFLVEELDNLLTKKQPEFFSKLLKNKKYRLEIECYTDLIYELECFQNELEEYKKTGLISSFSTNAFENLSSLLRHYYFQNRRWQFFLIEAQFQQYIYNYEFLVGARKKQLEDQEILVKNRENQISLDLSQQLENDTEY